MEKKLTDEQVLALDSVLVEGNEAITALHFEMGYYGRGGSNSSPYTEEVNVDKPLESIAGKPPLMMFGMCVKAVVNDVVYLADRSGKVVAFDKNGYCSDEYGVAYDTMEGWVIRPVVNKP